VLTSQGAKLFRLKSGKIPREGGNYIGMEWNGSEQLKRNNTYDRVMTSRLFVPPAWLATYLMRERLHLTLSGEETL
jgi:hypothetical protein